MFVVSFDTQGTYARLKFLLRYLNNTFIYLEGPKEL